MKTPQKPTLHIESTGDSSFDVILGGGIPAQSVVVIAGEPGSGKTVLTLQMLFRMARADSGNSASSKICGRASCIPHPMWSLLRGKYSSKFRVRAGALAPGSPEVMDVSAVTDCRCVLGEIAAK
jgi:hypothetical protein